MLFIGFVIIISIFTDNPGSFFRFHLSEEEQIWLDNNKGLRIAPDYSFAPIEFIEDDQFQGIAADYVAVLEDLLDYKFVIIKIKRWADNVEAAKNREIDIWSAVAPTQQKSEYMSFSEPYLDILSVLVVSKGDEREYDFESMGNKIISVVDGYFTHDYIKKNYPEIKLKLVDNASSGLQSVVYKDVDAMLIDAASVAWLIEKGGLTTLKIVREIDTEYHLSFASRSDMPVLGGIINRALKSISHNQRKEIYRKWINYSTGDYLDIKNFLFPFGFLISIISIIFVFIIFWNRSLRKMVSLRMDQLSEKDAQLIQSQKMEMVGTLAGGLAHDFNNILAGIIGTVSIIKLLLDTEGVIQTNQLRKYLALIDKSGDRAAKLVQQLLTISRKQKPNMDIIDLNSLVSNVSSILGNTLDKSINVDVIYSKHKAMIYADEGQIEQILLNFCVNASHAMTVMRAEGEDWGGTLSISIRDFIPGKKLLLYRNDVTNTNYWLVSVKDTGIGMDEDLINNIFTPFFTTKDHSIGTGLGLSMVYSIIHQHNGFIDVSSKPQIGSEFKLYIPKQKEVIHENNIISSNNKVMKKRSGVIMIVDDEQIIRQATGDILMKLGYKVIALESGFEAVSVFKKRNNNVAAIILDMAMPGMSGKDTYIQLKKIDKDVKVLLTSGFELDNRVKEVLDLGVQEFIQKPFTIERLLNRLDRIIDTK